MKKIIIGIVSFVLLFFIGHSVQATGVWDSTKVQGLVYGQSIYALNEQILLASGGGGIFRSVDGNVTWTKVHTIEDSVGVSDISFLPGSLTGYAVEGYFNSKILKTTDAGASWNVCFTLPDSLKFFRFCLKNENEMYVIFPGVGVGASGIFGSYDGGTSWTRLNSLNQFYISGLEVKDNEMYIATESNFVVRHVNGAESLYFREDSLHSYSNMVSFHNKLITGGYKWTVNKLRPRLNDREYKLNRAELGEDIAQGISVSTNQGQNWSSQFLLPGIRGSIRALASNNQIVYAVGSTWSSSLLNINGYIFSSVDGENWHTEPIVVTGDDLWGVSVVGTKVYVISSSGYVYTKRTLTHISEPVSIPDDYRLGQNYPNPFNPTTKISFSIPQNEFVTLKVYDMTGKEVALLVNEIKTAGNYVADFNATKLSSGIYFYTLAAGNFTETKKMLLIK